MKGNIIKWLTQCVMLAYDKPTVRETIKQYISLIKLLTGTDMENDSINEIVKAAVKNIESTAALIGAQDAIGEYLRREYIFKPLKHFYQDKEICFDSIKGNSEYQLTKKEWGDGRIVIASTENNWKRTYIGINYGTGKTSLEKLVCLKEEPNFWWPHGSEYLPADFIDLNSANSYVAMKEGRVADWIENKVKEIIDEATRKGFL